MPIYMLKLITFRPIILQQLSLSQPALEKCFPALMSQVSRLISISLFITNTLNIMRIGICQLKNKEQLKNFKRSLLSITLIKHF